MSGGALRLSLLLLRFTVSVGNAICAPISQLHDLFSPISLALQFSKRFDQHPLGGPVQSQLYCLLW